MDFADEFEVKRKLTEVLEQLSAIKPDNLARADELGKDLNFTKGIPVFERTLRLFSDLHKSSLDNIPKNVLDTLKSLSDDALNKINQIKNFSLSSSPQNPVAQRDTLIANLHNQYPNYFNQLAPIISYSIRKGTDFEALEKRARDILQNIQKVEEYAGMEQVKFLKEIENTLEKVRRAAAEVGVAQHAIHFQEAAKLHNKSSTKWLFATIGAAFLTVLWGAASFIIQPPSDTPSAIQFTVAKLIILSGLYYSLVWCARNYSAHRHNYIVHTHRHNALSTFETFVKAAGNDVDTKNAVLLQATQSIFSAQPSGYFGKDHDAEHPNKFIEIIKSASSSAQK